MAFHLNLDRYRWPYREDKVFSVLSLLVLSVPLVFDLYANENYETIKYVSWLILLGWALLILFRGRGKSPQTGEAAASGKNEIFRTDRIFAILSVVFVFWALLSTLHSLDPLYSVFGFYYRFTGSLLFYLTWAMFLLLLVSSLDRQRYIFLLKILVFDGLAIALLGFAQSLGVAYYQGLETQGFIRAPSLLGNPNFSAMFMAVVLPFAFVFLAGSKGVYQKIYYALAILFMILANVVLSSRGALLAILVLVFTGLVLAVWSRLSKKALKILAIGGTAVVIALSAIVVSRPDTIKPTISFTDSNITMRLAVWKVSLKGITKQPLLGSGPGTFALFFERNRNEALAKQSVGVFDDAHNLFLQMAETGGLPLLAVFLGILGLALLYGLKLSRRQDYLALAGTVSIVVFAVAASFNPVVIPCFMLLGVVVAGQICLRGKIYEFRQPRKFILRGLPAALKVAGRCLAVILILCGLSLAASEHLLKFAYGNFVKGNYSRAHLLSTWALRVNPTNSLYYTYRTNSEIMLGRPAGQVIAHIEQIQRLHPQQARTYANSAYLYNSLFLQTKHAPYLQQAVARLQDSLEIDPYYPDRHALLGLYYFQLNQHNEAISALRYGLSLDSKNFSSWLLLAKLFQQENNREQAVMALEKAYLLDPTNLKVKAVWEYAKRESDVQKIPLDIRIGPGVE